MNFLKKKVVIIGIIIIAIGAWLYGYSQYYKPPETTPQTPTTATPPPTTTQVAPANYAVSIKNFAFTPATLTIKQGDIVTFTNGDALAHTVTASAFGGQRIVNSGQSFSLDTKNLSPGNYPYACDFHPSMHGTIIIQ